MDNSLNFVVFWHQEVDKWVWIVIIKIHLKVKLILHVSHLCVLQIKVDIVVFVFQCEKLATLDDCVCTFEKMLCVKQVLVSDNFLCVFGTLMKCFLLYIKIVKILLY